MLTVRGLPFSILLLVGSIANAQVITRFAGDYINGYSGDNGPATAASLYEPSGLSVDAAGNVYIADFANNVVRKVSADGIITTFAGNTAQGYSGDNGAATAAKLYHPTGTATDAAGNVYIADAFNNVIRKVNAAGIITTVAGNHMPGYSGNSGSATDAKLADPNGIWSDAAGNLYIADAHNNVIRKVTTAGTISTIVGNGYNAGTTLEGYSGDGGPATAAELFYPEGVTIDAAGNLYVVELYNNTVRKINTSGIITTVAGNNLPGYSGDGGPATAAKQAYPYSMAVDADGNLYIADHGNNVIRRVDATGNISTIAGNGIAGNTGDNGPATDAQLNAPLSVALDQYGHLYIAEFGNNVVRRISTTPESVAHLSASGICLTISPNPCSGSFMLNLSSPFSEKAEVVMTNILGEIIKNTTVMTNVPTEIIPDVAAGIYNVKAITSSGAASANVVIR